MTNSALFLVVLITALFLVIAAMLMSRLLAPHSRNALKYEPYECGIPTRGASWVQFPTGYYLFAMLFLIFDVETVLLFPWAVVLKSAGMQGLACISFFLIVLTLGLAYAWRKGVLVWK
jgi:NADH-quinone oxidoreductase subunit A